jgi:hypothetical protein
MKKKIKPKRAFTCLLIPLLLISLAGCATIGPNTIARDRFDYSTGLATSWKNQMLLNIVKLRYMDTPVFLDVTSVINSYTLQTEVNLGMTFKQPSTESSQTLGGKGLYSDRPTITYSPLLGDKFSKALLTPTPPKTVFFLIQVGWRADLLLRLSVKSINGIYNQGSRGADQQDFDPRFLSLVEAIRRIQLSDAVGMRIRETEDGATPLIFFRQDLSEEVMKDIMFIRETLRLDFDAEELSLRFGAVPSSNTELAVLTRSMLEVIIAISAGVDVPPEHVQENRAVPAPTDPGFEPLIRIRSGTEMPEDAFTAIPYKDHWFWIEDTDLHSKRLFTFLIVLFTLTESGESAPGPIIPIPAG